MFFATTLGKGKTHAKIRMSTLKFKKIKKKLIPASAT